VCFSVCCGGRPGRRREAKKNAGVFCSSSERKSQVHRPPKKNERDVTVSRQRRKENASFSVVAEEASGHPLSYSHSPRAKCFSVPENRISFGARITNGLAVDQQWAAWSGVLLGLVGLLVGLCLVGFWLHMLRLRA